MALQFCCRAKVGTWCTRVNNQIVQILSHNHLLFSFLNVYHTVQVCTSPETIQLWFWIRIQRISSRVPRQRSIVFQYYPRTLLARCRFYSLSTTVGDCFSLYPICVISRESFSKRNSDCNKLPTCMSCLTDSNTLKLGRLCCSV